MEMLRKNNNLVKYEGGKAIGGGGFSRDSREATTKLLDGHSIEKPAIAGGTTMKHQIGGSVKRIHSNVAVRKVDGTDKRPNIDGTRAGRWRDTW
jgi:hypothetical protein